MTKTQFKKLKVGDWVRAIRPLFGYSVKDGAISTDLGPWFSQITAIGDGLCELKSLRPSGSSSTGTATYLEIVSKTRGPKYNTFRQSQHDNAKGDK